VILKIGIDHFGRIIGNSTNLVNCKLTEGIFCQLSILRVNITKYENDRYEISRNHKICIYYH
jgi:hypothetical protein